MFSAVGVFAQTKPSKTGSTQLTVEQNDLLNEALRLSHQVVQLNASGKFDEALPLARRAVELRRSVYGNNHPLVADGLNNVASLLLSREKFEQAEDLLKEALSSYENAGVVTQNMAHVLDTLTALRWRVRDYDKAESYGKRAIQTREKLYGARSPKILESFDNLLKVYESESNTAESNALYLRVLELSENSPHSVTNSVAQMLVIYHCSLGEAKETQSTNEVKKRIEALLGWQPGIYQEVTGGVLNGRALSLPKPSYPMEARLARASGQLVVEVKIDECGKVIDAKVVSGAIELRTESLVAARKARFSPTLLGLFPVKVIGVIQYNFVRQ